MGRKTEINEIKPTQVNYRKEDEYLSYSKLSQFAKDKVKYYKKFMLKEDEDDDNDEVKELRFGTMVDLFMTDEESFDKQFEIIKELPQPQVKKFCHFVLKRSKNGGDIS